MSRHSDGTHARGAKAVDGDARDGIWVVVEQPSHAGYVAILFAGAVGVAQDDLIDHGRVNPCLLYGILQHQGGEIIGADAG